jgi:hypothetical protein
MTVVSAGHFFACVIVCSIDGLPLTNGTNDQCFSGMRGLPDALRSRHTQPWKDLSDAPTRIFALSIDPVKSSEVHSRLQLAQRPQLRHAP